MLSRRNSSNTAFMDSSRQHTFHRHKTIRADLLRFGDVVLSSGYELKDIGVVMATRRANPARRYSHAALVIIFDMRHEVAAALCRRERDLIRIDTNITASFAFGQTCRQDDGALILRQRGISAARSQAYRSSRRGAVPFHTRSTSNVAR
jgi:hypothetical protein